MRRPRALALALLPLLVACAPAAVAPPPVAPAPAPAPVAVAAPAPVAPAPKHVDAGGMPSGLEAYAELRDAPALLAAIAGKPGLGAAPLALVMMAAAEGVPAATGDALVRAARSVHVGAIRVKGDLKVGASLALSDDAPVREALAAGIVERTGGFGDHGARLALRRDEKDGRGEIEPRPGPGPKPLTFVWFEGPRLLAAGDEPMLEAIADVVAGRTKPVRDAERGAKALAGEALLSGFVSRAMLASGAKGKVTFPSPVSAAYGLWEGGYRGGWRAELGVPAASAKSPVPPPRALAIARQLPAETMGYVALSLALQGGARGLRDLADQAGGAWGAGPAELAAADAALAAVGLRLDEIVDAVGGEGVAGVMVRRGPVKPAEMEKAIAFVSVIEVADTRPVDRLFSLAREQIAKKKAAPAPAGGKARKPPRVRPEPGGFVVELDEPAIPIARVRLTGGRIVLAAGQKDLVARAFEAVEKRKGTLGDDAAHARAIGVLPTTATARAWVDLGRAIELAQAQVGANKELAMLAALRVEAQGPTRPTSATSLRLLPEDGRVRFELDEVNGVGLLATSAIYGVRKYLANAKTAEAKTTLGAIARSAAAAYERERLGPKGGVLHALCKSARPVPAKIPVAMKYQASARPGEDWLSGDDVGGWRCLKFELSEPQYYRYTYTAGGPYKGPARGGPDPGPDGFEVAAEGDLDGDGVTSLFTRTGRVDRATGTVEVSPETFAVDESE